MQSDTVIGIVGAVVLVGVMVGVFAYEYNNVDSDEEPTEAERREQLMASFNETYGDLDPDGDLDGDGVPNYNETDLDGDGINNTEDDVFEYKDVQDAGGAISALPNAAGYSLTFEVEEGIRHVMVELSHAERLANDQTVLALNVQLDAAGQTFTPGDTTTSGGTTTYTIDAQDIGPGTYTLTVDPFAIPMANVGVDLGTSVTGDITFHYGPF